MEDEKTKCAICGNKSVALRRGKELRYELKNPGKVAVRADVYECERCGEDYLDEENMKKVAVEIDKARELAAKSVPADYDSVKRIRDKKKQNA